MVCKRANDGPAAVCSVCFTKRSYEGGKLNNISKVRCEMMRDRWC